MAHQIPEGLKESSGVAGRRAVLLSRGVAAEPTLTCTQISSNPASSGSESYACAVVHGSERIDLIQGPQRE